MSKYLDENGLAHYTSKIRNDFIQKKDAQEVLSIDTQEVNEIDTQDVSTVGTQEVSHVDTQEITSAELQEVQSVEIDSVPTKNSTHLVTSGGVYDTVTNRVIFGTKEYWRTHDFVPDAGVIVVYTDYETITEDGITKYYPAIKIGSGNGYLSDLAFIGGSERDTLLEHITNTEIHVTSADKLNWNNKLNVDDSQEVINESLILNRN